MKEQSPVSTPVKIGPWQRLSQREVYDNPWIRLTHESVITPGDMQGIYGKIHFKHRAIGIVTLDDDHGNREQTTINYVFYSIDNGYLSPLFPQIRLDKQLVRDASREHALVPQLQR
jgi:hypothetical protein